ncbi:hypothetical protein sphantq_04317 [Sphingobium sp. AntQ-1]|nr:hypothetical protein sphantq_04317 [Sphingobium sp. AntQ-1]
MTRLALRLDAFGQKANIQLLADGRKPFDDCRTGTTILEARNERTVNLYYVDRYRQKMGERGKARTKVVERNLETMMSHLCNFGADIVVAIIEINPFCNFNDQVF